MMSTMTALQETMLEDFGGKLQEEGISDDLQELIMGTYALERLPSVDAMADQIREATAAS